MDTITITETGCYLDNHRGIYLTRDAIQLAQGWGFIIGPFEQFAIDMFEDHDGDETFPFEGMIELCDEAVAWLNSGQSTCPDCNGSGAGTLATGGWKDKDGNWRCKRCTGTGRGDRIAGQNFPPKVPLGFVWNFEDGDFGLYQYDEDGNVLNPD